jgi:hypothetical protein
MAKIMSNNGAHLAAISMAYRKHRRLAAASMAGGIEAAISLKMAVNLKWRHLAA